MADDDDTQRSNPLVFKLVDLFTGTGAFSYAGMKTGRMRPVYACDMEPACKVIYEANHPGHLLTLADINTVQPESIPDCDILTGGFSCQPFSIAGKQLGFEDERSDVFWKTLQIIHRKRPRVAVLENVKNLISHDNGNTFKLMLEKLGEIGYHIKFQVLNTCEHTNIPQNRERVYILCFRNREDFTRFEFPSRSTHMLQVSQLIERNVAEKYFYTDRFTIYEDVNQGVIKPFTENVIYQYRRSFTRENMSSVCPTLTANMGTGGHNVPLIRLPPEQDADGEPIPGKIRKLTPRECFRFQGFGDEYILPTTLSDGKLYHLAGNAVSVNLVFLIYKNLLEALDANGDLRDEQPHNPTLPALSVPQPNVSRVEDVSVSKDLAEMSKDELLAECRQHGIRGYSGKKKSLLIEMIEAWREQNA